MSRSTGLPARSRSRPTDRRRPGAGAGPGAGPGAAGGFTLIEVVVALAILALSLGAVLQIFAVGLNQLASSGDSLRLLTHARSRLALVGRELPVEDARYEGESEDGFAWRTEIRPYQAGEDEALPDPETIKLQLYEVEVRVTAPGGRSLSLVSLRLGKPAP